MLPTPMLRLLLLSLMLLAPSVGSAQEFARTVPDLDPVLQVQPPAAFVILDQVDNLGEREFSMVAIRDGGGGLTVLADSLWRSPDVSDQGARWQTASLGCGTMCFFRWYLDPTTGRVSPQLFVPMYEDDTRGFVVVPDEDGVLLLDPLDLSWAWTLPIVSDSDPETPVMYLILDIRVEDEDLVVTLDGAPREVRAPLPSRAE